MSLHVIDPSWIEHLTSTELARAADERMTRTWNLVASAWLPDTAYRIGLPGPPKHHHPAADIYEIRGILVGDEVSTVAGTLDLYRAPEGDYQQVAAAPFAQPAIASNGGTVSGSELITNGTFAADSDWDKGALWSIAAGKASRTTGTPRSSLSQAVAVEAGKVYFLEMKVKNVSPMRLKVWIGNQCIGRMAKCPLALSMHAVLFTRAADAGDNVIRFESDYSTEVDDVSLKEVTPYRFGYVGEAKVCGSGLAIGFTPGSAMNGTYIAVDVQRHQIR